MLTKRYVGPGDSRCIDARRGHQRIAGRLGTSLFDETDDYNGYVAQPLEGAVWRDVRHRR